MAFYSENFNSWNQSQVKWRTMLELKESRIRCLPYFGPGHAMSDLSYGLKEFWPTRKLVALPKFGAPLVQNTFASFRREGYQFTSVFPDGNGEIIDWSKVNPSELLVAVVVRDHPLTGQILCTNEDLQKLNDKRIPFIEIQFGWAWSRSELPLPFGAQIRVIDGNKALVVFGQRFRFHNHTASLMDWSQTHWESDIVQCRAAHREEPVFLETFEREMLQKQTDISLLKHGDRLFDRSFMFLKGVSGDFYLNQLVKHIKGDPLGMAGYESRCETTNLNRWQGPYPWTWWGSNLLSESEQRNSVVLSATFIKANLSVELIHQVYLNCKSLVCHGYEECALDSKESKKESFEESSKKS